MSAPPLATFKTGSLARSVLRALRNHLRPLIAYHLFFTLFASLLVLPGIAWALTRILERFGRPVLTVPELIGLAMSPAGAAWLLLSVVLGFVVLYVQQAGMILLAVRPRDGHFQSAFTALWQALQRLPSLITLIILQVGAHLLLLLPVVFFLGWVYDGLLGGLDTYYVTHARPVALWYFVAIAVPLLLGWILAATILYVRWIIALPSVVLDQSSAIAALANSFRLTRNRSWVLGRVVVALLAVMAALPVIASLVFGWLATPLIGWLPDGHHILLTAMLAYVTLFVLFTLAIAFLGIAANALLSASLYLRLSDHPPHFAATPDPAKSKRLAWAVEIAVLIFAVSQAWWIVNSFTVADDVTIIAHRGSSLSAPENTRPAFQQAIADGADDVETDVRLTADGKAVLYHDRSLQRLIGDPRDIAQVEFDELRNFDVGSWFGDAFIGEPIPTLGEALETVRGKAGLMIDMKPAPGNEAALVEAVLSALNEETAQRKVCREAIVVPLSAAHCGAPEVFNDVRLAVGRPWLVDAIKQREPRLRVTLLAELVVPGTLERQGFDALGLRHNRINEEEIRLANHYGYELHAWTVNAPGEMSRMMDLGVDAIITDHPTRLAELVQQRSEMSDGELLLVKLRNWLKH